MGWYIDPIKNDVNIALCGNAIAIVVLIDVQWYVSLHCVPITLHWSRATNHSMCNMWIRVGAIGLPYNGMSNTKAGIMCWYSCMSTTWETGCPSGICRLWRHIGPIETPFFAGIFLCQGYDEWRRVGPTTMQGCVMMGGARWQMIHNNIWMDASCNNDWHPWKQLEMMVFRCQRCCRQLNTGMEHVKKHTYLNCRTTW